MTWSFESSSPHYHFCGPRKIFSFLSSLLYLRCVFARLKRSQTCMKTANRLHQNSRSAGFSLRCCCYTWVHPSVPLFLRCPAALTNPPSPQPYLYSHFMLSIHSGSTVRKSHHSIWHQTDWRCRSHAIFYSFCSSSYAWPQPCQFTSSPLHDCGKSSIVWQEATSRPAVSNLLTQTVWQISLYQAITLPTRSRVGPSI